MNSSNENSRYQSMRISQKINNSSYINNSGSNQQNSLSKSSKRYVPLIYRTDVMPPQYISKEDISINNDLQSDISYEDEYLDDEVYEFLQEVYQKKQKSKVIFRKEDLGVDLKELKDFYSKSMKESHLKSSNSNLQPKYNINNSQQYNDNINNNEFEDDFNIDFLDSPVSKNKMKKEKVKVYKPYKKFDEDFIHSYTMEKLYEFIEYKHINEYENEKFPKLKTIYVIYKHSHLPLNTMKIEEFYVPIYKTIEDKQDATEEYLDWLEYLVKRMNLRAAKAENLFLPGGKQIINFNSIPIDQKLIFITQNPELTFWKEFQTSHKIQINFQQQLDFAKELNNCFNSTQIYSSLISITMIEKKLRQQEKERQVKQQKKLQVKLIRQAEIEQKEQEQYISQQQQSINQSDLKFKKIEDEIIEEKNILELEQQKQEMVDMIKSQTDIRIKGIEQKIDTQNNLFRKYIQQSKSSIRLNGTQNKFPKNYAEVIKERQKYLESDLDMLRNKKKKEKKLQVLKKQEFPFQKLPNIQNQNSMIGREDPQKLLQMYDKYTGVLKHTLQSERSISPKMTSSNITLQGPNSKKQFNFGAVLQNFNKVRMKIMQSSLPNVIQKRLEEEQDTIKEQYKSQQFRKSHKNLSQSIKNNQIAQNSFYNPEFNQTKARKAKQKQLPHKLQVNDFFKSDNIPQVQSQYNPSSYYQQQHQQINNNIQKNTIKNSDNEQQYESEYE